MYFQKKLTRLHWVQVMTRDYKSLFHRAISYPCDTGFARVCKAEMIELAQKKNLVKWDIKRARYQYLLRTREAAGLKHCKGDQKALIECSSDMSNS